MKPSDKTMVLLSQIGKVFYSIAAVDKTVRPEEIKELKKIIQKNGCLSKMTLLIDSAILSIPEIVFDWLVENEWDKSNDA
jgi:hypothetical protein